MKMKKIPKILIVFLLYFMYVFFMSTLYYNGLVSSVFVVDFNLVFVFLFIYFVNNKQNHTLLKGGVTVGVLIIANLLFVRLFTIKTFIYYFIILFAFYLGGLDKKKES